MLVRLDFKKRVGTEDFVVRVRLWNTFEDFSGLSTI